MRVHAVRAPVMVAMVMALVSAGSPPGSMEAAAVASAAVGVGRIRAGGERQRHCQSQGERLHRGSGWRIATKPP